MPSVYFWKYEPGNYFSGTTIVDKLAIEKVPQDAFPVFDLITEDVDGIAQYIYGEFDVQIVIDSGETSEVADLSIYEFFKNSGTNYKYVVALGFGSYSLWGVCTQDKISFSYTSRMLSMQCRPIDKEGQDELAKSMVQELTSSIGLEQYLRSLMIPHQEEHRLTCATSFDNYSNLIGASGALIDAEIWNDAGWTGNVSVWQGFTELMMGLGLSFKFEPRQSPNISTDYPTFRIYVFPLAHIVSSGITPQIIEATNTTLFNKLEWLYIRYRSLNPIISPSESLDDGILENGVNRVQVDHFRASGISSTWPPYFSYQNFDREDTDNLYLWDSLSDPTLLATKDVNMRMLSLPLYDNDMWPDLGNMAICRSIHEGSALADNTFVNCQEYAVSQYRRFMGTVKDIKQLKVVFNNNNFYQLWESVTLNDNGTNKNYYVERIENIDLAQQTAEITLVQI